MPVEALWAMVVPHKYNQLIAIKLKLQSQLQIITKQLMHPMVGTFYQITFYDEEAYVQVGYTVSNETTVCILEAMKLFNKNEARICR